MHKLNNNWTFWIHLPNDIDWSINSYKKVYSFSTVEDAISLIENINEVVVQKCMLFIMRENIKPIWEDPHNNKGGCFSYKITNSEVYSVWKQLCYCLAGESLAKDKKIQSGLNGISISPKKNFCIIKLWLSDIEITSENNDLHEYIKKSIANEIEQDNQYDPFDIHDLCTIEKQNCVFKKHDLLY